MYLLFFLIVWLIYLCNQSIQSSYKAKWVETETLHLFLTSLGSDQSSLGPWLDDTSVKSTLKCLKVSLCSYIFSFILTMSVIRKVQVPMGFSPHVWTDMKSQFLKPLGDVSRSLSANSTVLVPIFMQQTSINECPINSENRIYSSIC